MEGKLMHRRLARVILPACLAAALVLVSAAPALAAPAAASPPFAGAARLMAMSPALGGVHAMADGFSELPAGSRITGTTRPDEAQYWLAVVHKGQVLSLNLSQRKDSWGPCDFAVLDLLTDDINSLALLDTTIGTGDHVQGDVTIPCDTIIAIASHNHTAEGTQHYIIDYTLSDPAVTSAVSRTSGSDRYATAIAISQKTFTSADTVVVATGRNFADALSASGLAGSYDCPILLTDPQTLSSGVDAEITRLGASTVLVVGSASAVSANVKNTLTHDGRTVRRLEGTTRFETAGAIADEIRAHETSANRTPSTEAFVVNGMNYPDALAVSPYAFAKKMPILLVMPTSVPQVTNTELSAMSASKAWVVGGPSVVSEQCKAALHAATSERIAGAGRVETALAAADTAVTQGWGSFGHTGLTTGWNYPDALGAAASIGKQGGVLLLSRPMWMQQDLYEKIADQRNGIGDVTLFGSTSALAGAVLGHTDHALRGDQWPTDTGPYGVLYGAN
jgi:putative cell wall-binding protein